MIADGEEEMRVCMVWDVRSFDELGKTEDWEDRGSAHVQGGRRKGR